MIREKLFNNIYFNSSIDGKFKNNMLMVKFIVPLKKETASKYAIVPYVLEMGNKQFKNIIELNKKLSELYGAQLYLDVSKAGEYQILSVGMDFIDNKYINNEENIRKDACELLLSILMEPNINENLFDAKNIKIAKNLLINKIENRINDKTKYAFDKCQELMFTKTPLGINKYGCKQDIELLTNEDVTNAYYNILDKAKIEIIYIGSSGVDEVKEICRKYLTSKSNECDFNVNFRCSKIKEEICNYEEQMEVLQSKLVAGFKFNVNEISAKQRRAIMIMNVIYGGSPFSKLFINVREKMSLCYECRSRYSVFSGSMFAFMGIESKNKEKALQESLIQLKDIQDGVFTLSDIENAKSTIENTIINYKDDTAKIADWYFTQQLLGFNTVIDEEIDLINKVSKSEIVEIASQIKLDTVYFLKGDE